MFAVTLASGQMGQPSTASICFEPNAAVTNTQTAASSLFREAERLKRAGDYQAAEYYERAIQRDPSEPCYDAFYADYLRNFRGALTPLFPKAEEHYFEALRKIALRTNSSSRQANKQVEDYTNRGLSALYERDGVVLATRHSDGQRGSTLQKPVVSLSSTNRYAQSTADLDQESDIRDYTSEALFSQSSQRLNAPLTLPQLRGMVRNKRPAETIERIRFRDGRMPVLDLFYGHRQTDNAQITDFTKPNIFNDLRLSEYGATVQKPFSIGGVLDASLSGTFELDQRWGLIETIPGAEERIINFAPQAAISHFFGPDKASLQLTYAYQWIHPEAATPMPDRHRQFVGSTATYEIFRRVPFLQSTYDKRFTTRGWDFFAGFLNDTEFFPPINVRQHDYFVGTALKGMANGRLDFTVQPTWFSSNVGGDPSQRNSQYRVNFTTLFRIVDEERHPIPKRASGLHLAFLQVVIPVRYDQAVTGPNFFENYKIGAEADMKLFTYSRWSTFLLSARYDRQQFYQLEKEARIYSLSLSLGF
jgi:hypothetical protein